MSTVLIVVIVVVVVLIVALLLVLPRMRERARVRRRQSELEQRREHVVDEHRQEAAGREREAEVAEQRARVAAKEAERQRAESRLAEEKARLHERGLADRELIDEDERSRFAGTSAVEDPPTGSDRAATASHDDPQRPRSTDEDNRAAVPDRSRVEDLEARRRDEPGPA